VKLSGANFVSLKEADSCSPLQRLREEEEEEEELD